MSDKSTSLFRKYTGYTSPERNPPPSPKWPDSITLDDPIPNHQPLSQPSKVPQAWGGVMNQSPSMLMHKSQGQESFAQNVTSPTLGSTNTGTQSFPPQVKTGLYNPSFSPPPPSPLQAPPRQVPTVKVVQQNNMGQVPRPAPNITPNTQQSGSAAAQGYFQATRTSDGAPHVQNTPTTQQPYVYNNNQINAQTQYPTNWQQYQGAVNQHYATIMPMCYQQPQNATYFSHTPQQLYNQGNQANAQQQTPPLSTKQQFVPVKQEITDQMHAAKIATKTQQSPQSSNGSAPQYTHNTQQIHTQSNQTNIQQQVSPVITKQQQWNNQFQQKAQIAMRTNQPNNIVSPLSPNTPKMQQIQIQNNQLNAQQVPAGQMNQQQYHQFQAKQQGTTNQVPTTIATKSQQPQQNVNRAISQNTPNTQQMYVQNNQFNVQRQVPAGQMNQQQHYIQAKQQGTTNQVPTTIATKSQQPQQNANRVISQNTPNTQQMYVQNNQFNVQRQVPTGQMNQQQQHYIQAKQQGTTNQVPTTIATKSQQPQQNVNRVISQNMSNTQQTQIQNNQTSTRQQITVGLVNQQQQQPTSVNQQGKVNQKPNITIATKSQQPQNINRPVPNSSNDNLLLQDKSIKIFTNEKRNKDLPQEPKTSPKGITIGRALVNIIKSIVIPPFLSKAQPKEVPQQPKKQIQPPQPSPKKSQAEQLKQAPQQHQTAQLKQQPQIPAQMIQTKQQVPPTKPQIAQQQQVPTQIQTQLKQVSSQPPQAAQIKQQVSTQTIPQPPQVAQTKQQVPTQSKQVSSQPPQATQIKQQVSTQTTPQPSQVSTQLKQQVPTQTTPQLQQVAQTRQQVPTQTTHQPPQPPQTKQQVSPQTTPQPQQIAQTKQQVPTQTTPQPPQVSVQLKQQQVPPQTTPQPPQPQQVAQTKQQVPTQTMPQPPQAAQTKQQQVPTQIILQPPQTKQQVPPQITQQIQQLPQISPQPPQTPIQSTQQISPLPPISQSLPPIAQPEPNKKEDVPSYVMKLLNTDDKPKNLKKGKTPYLILKLLKEKGASTPERAVTKAFILDELKQTNNLQGSSVNEPLRKTIAESRIIHIKESDTYYISEKGLKALDQCENSSIGPITPGSSPAKSFPINSVQSQYIPPLSKPQPNVHTPERQASSQSRSNWGSAGHVLSEDDPIGQQPPPPQQQQAPQTPQMQIPRSKHQPSPQSPSSLWIPDDFISKSEGNTALILSMFYLGATYSRNAVMRSDIISEGKNFTDKLHTTYHDGGKYNLGKTLIKKLLGKGYIKEYKNFKINISVMFLTKTGNAAARELIKRDIPRGSCLISYKSYEAMPKFKDIRDAILCVLMVYGATSVESGVIYPFIVTEVNYIIGDMRGMDDGIITPEYAALFDVVKNGLVEKSFNKETEYKFYLTQKGKEVTIRSIGDDKFKGYLTAAKGRKEKSPKKKKGNGRKKQDDNGDDINVKEDIDVKLKEEDVDINAGVDDEEEEEEKETEEERKEDEEGEETEEEVEKGEETEEEVEKSTVMKSERSNTYDNGSVIDLIDYDELEKNKEENPTHKRSSSDPQITYSQQPQSNGPKKNLSTEAQLKSLPSSSAPTPLKKTQEVDTHKKPNEEQVDDDDDLEIIGVQQMEVIYLDDEPPAKKRACGTTDSPSAIVVLDDDSNSDKATELDDCVPQVKPKQKLWKVDHRIARKYPLPDMTGVFSIISPLKTIPAPPKIIGVRLIIDTREPLKIKEKIKVKFAENRITCEENTMSTGDYIWVATGIDGKDYLLNAIIERKAVLDFDSSLKDGRYHAQISKMKATNISNILYLIEGAVEEMSFNNVSFEEIQKSIENVSKKEKLKLIRTLSQDRTVSFFVNITKSLNSALREGKLTENFFAYPLRGLEGLKDEDPLSSPFD